MSELREAAQAAVDAFNEHGYSPLTVKAIWALRDALAEDRLAEPAKGEAKIRIPTATMEQEFSNYHRIGYKAGATAEREACATEIEALRNKMVEMEAALLVERQVLREDEREACAEICDRIASLWPDSSLEGWREGYVDGAGACRNLIRERGQK